MLFHLFHFGLFNFKDLVAKQHPVFSPVLLTSMQHNLNMDTGEKLVCSEIREASGVCVWGSSVYKSNSIVLHYRIQSTISLHFPFIKGGAHMPLVDASETYLPGQPYLFLIICGQTIPARHNTANSSSSSSLPFCFCLHLVQLC